MDYTYNLREFSQLLGFPFGPDVISMTQENLLPESDLDYFWGSIAGNNHPEPSDLYSECIHNPAIRYFHKIIAHTIFGKQQNVTSVSRDELFIMYCASQSRPMNGAAYMLANMERIIQTPNAPILLGGLVTMLSNAIGLRRPMLGSAPLYGIKPMDIAFCFNTSMIGNLGPDQFDLLVNHQTSTSLSFRTLSPVCITEITGFLTFTILLHRPPHHLTVIHI